MSHLKQFHRDNITQILAKVQSGLGLGEKRVSEKRLPDLANGAIPKPPKPQLSDSLYVI